MKSLQEPDHFYCEHLKKLRFNKFSKWVIHLIVDWGVIVPKGVPAPLFLTHSPLDASCPMPYAPPSYITTFKLVKKAALTLQTTTNTVLKRTLLNRDRIQGKKET